MRKLYVTLIVGFLATTSISTAAGVSAPKNIPAPSAGIRSVPEGYVDTLNEQTRATKVLLKHLGIKKMLYTDESLDIGRKIDKIVDATYTGAYNIKTRKVDFKLWHQLTDLEMAALSVSLLNDGKYAQSIENWRHMYPDTSYAKTVKLNG